MNLDWLVLRLAIICPPILVAIYLIMWGHLILGGSGLLDRTGTLIGGDYSYYWTAAHLAWSGEPASVYDAARLSAIHKGYFGVGTKLIWSYPPTFLLLLLPLAFLPFLASLTTWILLTLGGYLLILRRIAPRSLTIWWALAFPATFQNFAYGQNGFLSAILLGGGLLLLETYPFMGGLVLGLLTYKPHLAVLAPLALLAGRRWRALGGLVTGAAGLALASLLAFGPDTWLVFLKSLIIPLRVLESGKVAAAGSLPLEKMTSVFAAVRQTGLGAPVALALQGVVSLAVAALVARVWSRPFSAAGRYAVLSLGTLLFTPYNFVYDLALLALPLAWLGWQAYQQGCTRAEALIFFLAWLTPLISLPLAAACHFQIAPLSIILLFILAWRRDRVSSF